MTSIENPEIENAINACRWLPSRYDESEYVDVGHTLETGSKLAEILKEQAYRKLRFGGYRYSLNKTSYGYWRIRRVRR